MSAIVCQRLCVSDCVSAIVCQRLYVSITHQCGIKCELSQRKNGLIFYMIYIIGPGIAPITQYTKVRIKIVTLKEARLIW